MKIIITNWGTGEVINTVDLKTKNKVNNGFRILDELGMLQKEQDILKIGKLGRVVSWGIGSIWNDGVTGSTWNKGSSSILLTGANSFQMGNFKDKDVKEPEYPEIITDNGRETLDFKVAIDMYEQGWAISTGKQGSNIFGGRFDAFISSIGSRNIHSGAISGARLFATKKAVLAYLEKYQSVLRFCVEEYGYYVDVKPACSYFETEYQESLNTTKKVAKDEEIQAAINNILGNINREVEEEEEDDIPDVEVADADTIEIEIISRMKKLDLWTRIIQDYVKTGKIYQSEYGGVLYDLNEEAQKVVETVKAKGLIPYHVVVTPTALGTFYDVLYCSNAPANWGYERPTKDNVVSIYAKCIDEEFGSAKYISCNGGLQKVS